MIMHQEISVNDGILNVVASGKFSLAEAKKRYIEMLWAVAHDKAEKVLFDGRRLVGNPEPMERFFYGEFAANTLREFGVHGVYPGTKFAYVLKVPIRDPNRLGETVAVNRGMLVKTFDDLEDAFRWLNYS